MVQIVEMTHDEKVAMYMKQPKKKLVEMLIQCNLHLEHYTKQLQIHNVSGSLLRKKAKEYAKLLYAEGYNDPIYHQDVMQTMRDFEAGFKAGINTCNDC